MQEGNPNDLKMCIKSRSLIKVEKSKENISDLIFQNCFSHFPVMVTGKIVLNKNDIYIINCFLNRLRSPPVNVTAFGICIQK